MEAKQEHTSRKGFSLMKRTATHSQGTDDEPATCSAKPTPRAFSPWANARAFGSNSWWVREKTEKAETGNQLCPLPLPPESGSS